MARALHENALSSFSRSKAQGNLPIVYAWKMMSSGGNGLPPGPPNWPSGPAAKPITGSPSTMAVHAMTIDPRTGLPRGEQPPASTAAVIALLCGILLCLGPITGVPAIVAGVLARRAVRQFPHTVGGANMATAGLTLGVLNLLLSTLGVAAALVYRSLH